MTDPDKQLEWLLVDLRACDSQDAEAELGRSELAGFLHRAPKLLDKVLKLAKRDYAMLRCLSGARYYSGLDADMCASRVALRSARATQIFFQNTKNAKRRSFDRRLVIFR